MQEMEEPIEVEAPGLPVPPAPPVYQYWNS